ncbi:MAG: hypothetical protein WC492_00275 [Candidatus Micrarchaeia archaeon]
MGMFVFQSFAPLIVGAAVTSEVQNYWCKYISEELKNNLKNNPKASVREIESMLGSLELNGFKTWLQKNTRNASQLGRDAASNYNSLEKIKNSIISLGEYSAIGGVQKSPDAQVQKLCNLLQSWQNVRKSGGSTEKLEEDLADVISSRDMDKPISALLLSGFFAGSSLGAKIDDKYFEAAAVYFSSGLPNRKNSDAFFDFLSSCLYHNQTVSANLKLSFFEPADLAPMRDAKDFINVQSCLSPWANVASFLEQMSRGRARWFISDAFDIIAEDKTNFQKGLRDGLVKAKVNGAKEMANFNYDDKFLEAGLVPNLDYTSNSGGVLTRLLSNKKFQDFVLNAKDPSDPSINYFQDVFSLGWNKDKLLNLPITDERAIKFRSLMNTLNAKQNLDLTYDRFANAFLSQIERSDKNDMGAHTGPVIFSQSQLDAWHKYFFEFDQIFLPKNSNSLVNLCNNIIREEFISDQKTIDELKAYVSNPSAGMNEETKRQVRAAMIKGMARFDLYFSASSEFFEGESEISRKVKQICQQAQPLQYIHNYTRDITYETNSKYSEFISIDYGVHSLENCDPKKDKFVISSANRFFTRMFDFFINEYREKKGVVLPPEEAYKISKYVNDPQVGYYARTLKVFFGNGLGNNGKWDESARVQVSYVRGDTETPSSSMTFSEASGYVPFFRVKEGRLKETTDELRKERFSGGEDKQENEENLATKVLKSYRRIAIVSSGATRYILELEDPNTKTYFDKTKYHMNFDYGMQGGFINPETGNFYKSEISYIISGTGKPLTKTPPLLSKVNFAFGEIFCNDYGNTVPVGEYNTGEISFEITLLKDGIEKFSPRKFTSMISDPVTSIAYDAGGVASYSSKYDISVIKEWVTRATLLGNGCASDNKGWTIAGHGMPDWPPYLITANISRENPIQFFNPGINVSFHREEHYSMELVHTTNPKVEAKVLGFEGPGGLRERHTFNPQPKKLFLNPDGKVREEGSLKDGSKIIFNASEGLVYATASGVSPPESLFDKIVEDETGSPSNKIPIPNVPFFACVSSYEKVGDRLFFYIGGSAENRQSLQLRSADKKYKDGFRYFDSVPTSSGEPTREFELYDSKSKTVVGFAKVVYQKVPGESKYPFDEESSSYSIDPSAAVKIPSLRSFVKTLKTDADSFAHFPQNFEVRSDGKSIHKFSITLDTNSEEYKEFEASLMGKSEGATSAPADASDPRFGSWILRVSTRSEPIILHFEENFQRDGVLHFFLIDSEGKKQYEGTYNESTKETKIMNGPHNDGLLKKQFSYNSILGETGSFDWRSMVPVRSA